MAILDLAAPQTAPDAPARPLTSRVEGVLVLVAVAWWGTVLTWGAGGREAHVLSIGLVLAAAAAAAVRPWRRLPAWPLAGLVAVGLAAAAVVLTAPTGRAGANAAAAWVYAALLTAVVAVWASTSERRRLLVAALAVAPALSFARSWLAWWGGQNPSKPFVGTFYWHNQAGVFLALGVLAGVVVVLVGARTQVLLGWLVIAVCGAGVVVSTSRGALAALVLGLAVLLVLAALQPRRRLPSVAAVLAVPGVVAATAWLLTGPPFFAARGALLSGTQARSAQGETLSANSAHRLDDWAHAWRVVQHWPLTGAGFHGFAAASKQVDPAGRGSLTPFAHNGFLQLLVDGGLLLAVPVLLLLAALAVSVVRRLPAAVRSSDWPFLGGFAALVALAVHSGMDFDWSYPALLGALAVVGGLMWAPSAPSPGPRRWRLGLAGAYLVLVALAAVAAWGGILDLNAGLGGQS